MSLQASLPFKIECKGEDFLAITRSIARPPDPGKVPYRVIKYTKVRKAEIETEKNISSPAVPIDVKA